MDRKAVARETLEIMQKGFYELEGEQVEIGQRMRQSVHDSFLITPEQGKELVEKYRRNPAAVDVRGLEKPDMPAGDLVPGSGDSAGYREDDQNTQVYGMPEGSGSSRKLCTCSVENISTVDAIRKLSQEGKRGIGVLNFASAKNPGGGFINGAMAQEESLAASGTLYRTLTAHEAYYRMNRAQSSMMYTDHAIYSPGVLFFRDGQFRLVKEPVEASVLTLPAVNMGQVLLKGENRQQAEQVMRHRMELALAIFASQGAGHLVLGAYGCGVFRNDPAQVAGWWKELLEEGWSWYFDSVFHAVLDRSRSQECIRAFQQVLL